MGSKDTLFKYFITGLFIIITIYMIGMLVALFFVDEALAAKLINGFVGVFGTLIGLGSGYLLGRGNGNGHG